MSSTPDRDFTQIAVPQSWLDAADESPSPEGLAYHGQPDPVSRPVLTVDGLELFTGLFATLGTAMVVGYAWFLLHTQDVVTSPWIAVAVGVILALAFRLSAGKAERPTRIVVSVASYVATALVVVLLITSHNYRELYGSRPSLAELEQELLYSRLIGLRSWAAWGVGAVAAALTSRAT